MRNNGWDNGGPTVGSGRQVRGKAWLKWMLLGCALSLGIAVMIGSTFAGIALRHRKQLWPAVRSVHTRLLTDEGAKDLLAKNPALARSFASEQDFLDTARVWRAKVGGLPVEEPIEGPAYQTQVAPEGVTASIQGKGGAWMKVEIQGGGFGEPVEGEGVRHLIFGPDQAGLEAAEKKADEQRIAQDWKDLRGIAQQCMDDRSALALYRQEPGLRSSYSNEARFLEHVKILRPILAKLPDSQPVHGHGFSIHHFQTPLGQNRVLTFREKNGQRVSATWKDGQLSKVELGPPNHRG